MTAPPSADARRRVENLLHRWIQAGVDDNPAIVGYERGEPDEHLWIVRLVGEAKPKFAVRFVVGQRTLRAETYLLPMPPQNQEDCFEFAMRANHRLYGVAFEIGPEDALFVAGQLDLRHVDEEQLDRLLGTLYEVTERCFPELLRRGFNTNSSTS